MSLRDSFSVHRDGNKVEVRLNLFCQDVIRPHEAYKECEKRLADQLANMILENVVMAWGMVKAETYVTHKAGLPMEHAVRGY